MELLHILIVGVVTQIYMNDKIAQNYEYMTNECL